MKKVQRVILVPLKWTIIVLAGVEVMSFLVLTVANFFIYGSAWEGSRVSYDPYTLFQEGPRATAHNPPDSSSGNSRVIWMFGGSTMRGSTDEDARTIPSFLAGILNSPGQVHDAVTVHNFGENSFNSLLESKYLQKAFVERPDHPDLLIFYDGANEGVYFSQFRTPYAHHGYQRVKALIESHRRSFLSLFKTVTTAVYASFTWELYDKMRETVIPIRADSPELRTFVERTVERYDYVNDQAGFYGASFVLFWQPALWMESCAVDSRVAQVESRYAVNRARFTAVRQNFQVVYLGLAEALRDRPYFVDLQEVLCPRTELAYKPDGVHLQDSGREMVARAMARILMERDSAGR